MELRRRPLALMAAITAVACALASCRNDLTDPARARAIRPGAASADGGNSWTTATIDARVLLNKAGTALLDVHTGTYTDATNTGAPSGTLTGIYYSVNDSTGNDVANQYANASGTSYTDTLRLCSSDGGGGHDDAVRKRLRALAAARRPRRNDDGGDGHGENSSCSNTFVTGDSAWVIAQLAGSGNDDEEEGPTGYATARILNLPDIDLSNQSIYLVGAGGSQTVASTVTASLPSTFSVTFPNNKAIHGVPNAVGAQTVCVVTVDGTQQSANPPAQYNQTTNPNAFGYIGPSVQNIAAGAVATCQFTLALSAGVHHVMVTAVVNPPGDYDPSNNSTANVLINAVPASNATNLIVKQLERVGDGVNASNIISVDTTQSNTTVTIRSVIQNPTITNANVDCTLTADSTLQATPVGATTGVSVPALGSAVCQYTVAPLGIGSFPLSIVVAASTGSAVAPSSTNNATSATLRVVTGGRFSFDVTAMDIEQRWFNLLASSAFPAESLSLQNVRVKLAVLAVPAQDVIGSFTLKGTVIDGATTFPTGTLTGTLHQSAAGTNCGTLTAGPDALFSGVPVGFPKQIGYFADICSEPATVNGVGGLQRITVDYVQSLAASIMNPGTYLLTGTIQVQIQLSFTLQGSSTPDQATATVNLNVPAPIRRSLTSLDGTRVMWTVQNPAPAIVSTP